MFYLEGKSKAKSQESRDLVANSVTARLENENTEVGVEGSRMSILQHLSELSVRLKKSLLAFLVAVIVVSILPNPFHPFGGPNSLFGYNFLLVGLVNRAENSYASGFKFFATGILSPMSVFLNISLVLGLLVSLPFMFYEMYGFIAPGLYQSEKRVIRKYLLPFAILLAIGGIFGLFVIFPVVMRILLDFYMPFNLSNLISLEDFVNLLLLVPTLTGLSFTFPVFLTPLVELKILSAKQLANSRKWVYLGVALGVSIANPDPTDISSIPIIVPIIILFELTIFIAKRIERNRLREQTANQKSSYTKLRTSRHLGEDLPLA